MRRLEKERMGVFLYMIRLDGRGWEEMGQE